MSPFLGFKQMNSLCGISEERKSRFRKRIRFWKWRTASGQFELENQKLIKYIYTQIDGVFQSKLRILETGDTLRWYAFCYYWRYCWLWLGSGHANYLTLYSIHIKIKSFGAFASPFWGGIILLRKGCSNGTRKKALSPLIGDLANKIEDSHIP